MILTGLGGPGVVIGAVGASRHCGESGIQRSVDWAIGNVTFCTRTFQPLTRTGTGTMARSGTGTRSKKMFFNFFFN